MIAHRLSRSKIHAADRVGGIELMLPWPDGTPPPADLRDGDERPASPTEYLAAMQMVAAECEAAGLVPVRVSVCVTAPPRGEPAPHMAVIIIGQRWVHATGAPAPKTKWATCRR